MYQYRWIQMHTTIQCKISNTDSHTFLLVHISTTDKISTSIYQLYIITTHISQSPRVTPNTALLFTHGGFDRNSYSTKSIFYITCYTYDLHMIPWQFFRLTHFHWPWLYGFNKNNPRGPTFWLSTRNPHFRNSVFYNKDLVVHGKMLLKLVSHLV